MRVSPLFASILIHNSREKKNPTIPKYIRFKGFSRVVKGDIMFALLPKITSGGCLETEKYIKETIKLKQKNLLRKFDYIRG